MAINCLSSNLTNQADTGHQLKNIDSITNYGGVNTLTSDSVIGSGDSSTIHNHNIICTVHSNDISNVGKNRTVDLGAGNDILQGFLGGRFVGGSGIDTLKLPRGTYRVSISGSTVKFTRDGVTVYTSGFEKLIAGRTYSFDQLTNGQRIRF